MTGIEPLIEVCSPGSSQPAGRQPVDQQPDGRQPIDCQPVPPGNTRAPGLGLAQRGLLFLLLIAVEWIPLSMAVHKGRGAGVLFQIAFLFLSLFLGLGYFKARSSFEQLSREMRSIPFEWPYLAWHIVPFLAFVLLSFLPGAAGASSQLPGRWAGQWAGQLSGPLPAALWYVSGFLAIALAGRAFLPPRMLVRLVHGTGYAWVYALITSLAARALVTYSPLWPGAAWDPSAGFSWKPANDLTFGLVKAFLSLLLPNVFADRASMRIGTSSFRVIIAPWCTGFEGTVLVLLFSAAWLWFFRKEFRFPRALLLVPAGLIVIWICNALRITALILIGVAGYPAVAIGGFHSQAGWVAFNAVALGFAILSQRVAWFRHAAAAAENSAPVANDSAALVRSPALDESREHNPTVAYLMPFVTILAAGMISGLASGGFEWLYPLRVVAALVTLWFFRAKYRELDWRFGWQSVAAGCAVLAIWLGLDGFMGASTASGIGTGLATWPAAARIAWLVFRTAGAVVTVPIAEELAFRSFLIRRLQTADFESLPPRTWTYFAVLVSSLAFGLMHGDRWLAGTLAGLIYALAYLRRGRIGDAVVAHATTNALLAGFVLLGGRWYLW